MGEEGSSVVDGRYELTRDVLYDKEKGTPHFEDEIRMPYEDDLEFRKPIGAGAYGVVYRVKISGGHLLHQDGKSSNAR